MRELDHKEGWVLKNWCFWIMVLQKTLLTVPWTERSNQPILKEISPEYSLEGLMLKLKVQYFGHLMWRTDSLEKTLMGKTDSRKETSFSKGTREGEMVGRHHQLDGHEFEQAPGVGNGQGGLVLQSMGSQRVGHNWATELICGMGNRPSQRSKVKLPQSLIQFPNSICPQIFWNLNSPMICSF